jgi:hypothetical protein
MKYADSNRLRHRVKKTASLASTLSCQDFGRPSEDGLVRWDALVDSGADIVPFGLPLRQRHPTHRRCAGRVVDAIVSKHGPRRVVLAVDPSVRPIVLPLDTRVVGEEIAVRRDSLATSKIHKTDWGEIRVSTPQRHRRIRSE